MKFLSAILGTAFVMFVSVAAMDGSQATQNAPAMKAASHAGHVAGKSCCDKGEGAAMCARDGKDAKGCCNKPDCCKDDCCKDGTCKDNCTCECCKDGSCCKHDEAAGATKNGCCKKPSAKKPGLTPAH